jgi:hypothetical protein
MSIQSMTQQHDDDFSGKVPSCLKMGGGTIAKSVPSKRSLQKFAAENQSTFTETNNIIRFNINSGSLLDLPNATFGFDLSNAGSATNDFQLDGSAACLIDTFRVYAQDGTELERIQEYGLLDSILSQYTGDLNEDSIMTGAPERRSAFPEFDALYSGAGATGTAAADSTVDTKSAGLKIQSVLSGAAGAASILTVSSRGGCGYDQLQSDKLNGGIKKHYELPLRCSGWFNPAMNKLLPPNCSFTVEIQLNTAVKSLLKLGAGTDAMKYNMSATYLNIPSVTINDPVCLSHLQDKMAQGISWTAYSYSHHVNTTTGSGEDTVQINARVYDLNGLISCVRRQANLSVSTKMSLSKRSIQGIQQYQYTIGSQQYPPQPVKITLDGTNQTTAGTQTPLPSVSSNISQCFSELKRVLQHVKRVGGGVNISTQNFAQSELNQGTGVLSVDVAAYNDHSTMSGLDSKSTSMPVTLDISKEALLTDVTCQIDTFALHGVEFTRISDGRIISSY